MCLMDIWDVARRDHKRQPKHKERRSTLFIKLILKDVFKLFTFSFARSKKSDLTVYIRVSPWMYVRRIPLKCLLYRKNQGWSGNLISKGRQSNVKDLFSWFKKKNTFWNNMETETSNNIILNLKICDSTLFGCYHTHKSHPFYLTKFYTMCEYEWLSKNFLLSA